ncbi:MAG: PHP domain-containing protein [Candidatus Thorarchaeota archaeon]|jgi:putative hydrolase
MSTNRTDLHIHSDFSDGHASVEDIVRHAAGLRLDTIAIVDHFWPSLGSRRGGLNLIEERRRILKNIRQHYPKLRVLEGAEVDIMSDGTIAPVAGGLGQFNFVIGSVHWGSDSLLWSSAVAKAATFRSFDILGHWDGYLNSFRREHGERVAKALADNEIAVELSLRYEPLFEGFLEMARDYGCRFTLGSDSHGLSTIGKLHDLSQLADALDLPLLTVP